MRLIGAAATVYVLAMAFGVAGNAVPTHTAVDAATTQAVRDALPNQGQHIFRYDTLGDEQLWTDVLRMHEVIPKISPETALAVGLKVDVEALPAEVVAAIATGAVKLTDPAVTVELLRLNAVVGVMGTVEEGQLTRVGITCALCHSSVDDSFAPGVGKRLDGWANTDLNVGAIVALSPALAEDEKTKAEFNSWGPGKYDPRHHYFDGMNIVPLNPSLPIVIPPIYGLQGVGFETFTADGPISYWNSYVGVGQMGGQGTFNDPRVGVFINQSPDLVTPKLKALLRYQLSLKAPEPPAGSYDREAARRGALLFRDEARCSTCHRGPNFTDVLSGPNNNVPFLHDPSETKMDPAYAARTATGRYRTTPLRGLFQHAPYFHDGSAPDLEAVVEHYNTHFKLGLTPAQKADLVQYLKSL